MTVAGIVSRIIGFFYRIFLSRTIGAESLGLYQLVFPLLGICFSISSSGIQTSISRFVAEAVSSCFNKENGEKKARKILGAGLIISSILSLICGLVLFCNAKRISIHILGDERCADLLVILSFCLLPASIHSCINGYYYGKKKALVPSFSQLVEQIARVLGVYLMYLIVSEQGRPLTAIHAVWGIVISEFFGLLFNVTALKLSPCNATTSMRYIEAFKKVIIMALPLTLNHTLVHIFSGLENILIPKQLQAFGYLPNHALEIFGVLSGMAISVVFFPSVLTNSLSVLLLPAVSEAKTKKNHALIASTTRKAIAYGLLLGFTFTVIFLISGDFIGNTIFQNALAGNFIKRLSFLCPLMYVYSLLSSILHGLGQPKNVLFINLLASLIRIVMILFLVPYYGIGACLWGMLLSELFAAIAAIVFLRNYFFTQEKS